MTTDKLTILAVDDNRQNLMLLAHLLKSAPVTLETARNGEQAILLCKKKQYDLLMLDYLMPSMDGPETLRRIQEDESGQNHCTPAVMMTADKLDNEIIYLKKPFTIENLNEILSQCLGIRIHNNVAASTDTKSKFNNWMEKLEERGISASDGLRYSGGDGDFYRSLLLLFADNNTIAAKAQKLNDAKSNPSDQSILVTQAHAIKGEARGIGADKLGELFYELELAAKENDRAKIEIAFPAAMEEWQKIANIIRSVL